MMRHFFVIFLAVFFDLTLILQEGTASARVFDSYADIIRQVEPSIVHIRSRERPLSRGRWIDPYAYFFQTQPPQNSSQFALGTGFLIQPSGYCLTSFQVVDGMQRLEVVTQNKKVYEAEYIGGDRQLDLALLRLKGAKALQTVDFADSTRLKPGDLVLGFGFPLGFGSMVSSGIVSAASPVMGAGAFDSHLVLDLATHPGNIGGPLIDTRGRVVGLLSSPSASLSQIGFALPAKRINEVLAQLMKHGKLNRAWLGLVARNIASMDSITELYDPKIKTGVLVDNLIIDGPASKAKLQVGDLILGFGKESIRSVQELDAYLRRVKPGLRQTVEIFRRRGGAMQLNIEFGEMPAAEDLPEQSDLY